MQEAHQVLPTLVPGDAIGNEVIEIRKVLRKWGYVSEVYAENVHPKLAGVAESYRKLDDISQEALLIYHYSIGSDLTRIVRRLQNRLCIVYHGITPYEYYIGVNETLARLLRKGLDELPSLRERTAIALGDSEFDRQELIQMGFQDTAVLPTLLDFCRYDTPPSPEMVRRYDDDSVNILFVGRYSPNKRLEDLIKVFGYYQKCINDNSRLLLVGSYLGTEVYYRFLLGLVRKFSVQNVHFITDPSGGPSKTSELVACYQLADVFLTMSEHEGFCVPLIESMHFRLPILAYSAAAVPFVLGEAGILISDRNYAEIAELVHMVVEDQALRRAIVEKQTERLQGFSREKVEASLRAFLNRLSR